MQGVHPIALVSCKLCRLALSVAWRIPDPVMKLYFLFKSWHIEVKTFYRFSWVMILTLFGVEKVFSLLHSGHSSLLENGNSE